MENQDLFVGLDIGTTSIKVIVAESISGQLNVIGVGSQRSAGLSRGVIVDIDKAVEAIRLAVAQAEQKANIEIKQVVVGVPANMLQIEPVSGMIAVGEQGKEIADGDVQNVAAAALVRNLPPEREVLSLMPTEFTVDGFDKIKDPRGMIGVRLEMKGILFTAPKTVLHNTKKAVEKAGLQIRTIVANPLAAAQVALSDSEQNFGTILLDFGGGQSTAAVIHDRKLKFAFVDSEGGENITQDISIVLNTGFAEAEKLKRDYGNADSLATSEDETFPVAIVGRTEPAKVSEKHLSEIIEARVQQMIERLKDALEVVHAFDLPGGVVITGGTTALPGVVELAQDTLGGSVKRFIPDEMGLRHPAFTQALGLITYAAKMTDIEALVSTVLPTPVVRTAAEEEPARIAKSPNRLKQLMPHKEAAEDEAPVEAKKPKESKLKKFFGDFFE